MIYGHQILRAYERLHALGLTDSKKSFSVNWCGKGEDLLRDYERRSGRIARVSDEVVTRIRSRLAESASHLPDACANEVRAIDEMIGRDLRIADLIGRRSVVGKGFG